MIKAALDTLRDLDLGPYLLLGFAQEVLALYGCSDDATVRKAAALATWRVVERQWGLLQYAFTFLAVVFPGSVSIVRVSYDRLVSVAGLTEL